jgi:hypothetical protein
MRLYHHMVVEKLLEAEVDDLITIIRMLILLEITEHLVLLVLVFLLVVAQPL